MEGTAPGTQPKSEDLNILRDKGNKSFTVTNPLWRKPDPSLQKEGQVIHFTEETLKAIKDILYEKEGFDLDSYKDKCIQRRISLRIRTSGCKAPNDYIFLLKRDEREVKKLLDTLTINVTEFFRNRSTFDKLREVILPDIFSMKEMERSIRIWSAGCASGEEPYTIAMILKWFFPEELKRFNISITATDVDEGVLERALDAVYTKDRVTGVDPLLKKRFFEEDGEKYRLSAEIKKMVGFKREDIFREKRHGGYDLIICRNLLIYFSRERQEWVLKEFWEDLNHGGFLVLGRAEILVGESRMLFSAICPKERIYRKPF